MENLTGGTPPVRPLPCVVPCKLYFLSVTLHIYGQSTVKSRLFRRIFAVILTDNGSEFKHTRELETAEVWKKGKKVFYCEPQASRQKPQIEKNREFIRYVLPKGKTLNPYTQEDITVV